MYNCVVNITLVGENDWAADLLSGYVPPEDCEIVFSEKSANTPDSAAVYFGAEAYRCKSAECAYSVLVTDGSDLDGVDISELTAVWLLPSDKELRAKLIALYFNQLISHIKNSFDHRILKICFETVSDSVPDLMWFKDMTGAHLMVNDAFCKAVAKTKKQIYKQGHYYIWDIPKEEYEQGDYVCLESEQQVIDAGGTICLDENVKTKAGMKQFKTYKSPMYDVDGSVFGTCGVARDVTDLHKINSELAVLLESIPFAVMINDNEGDIVGSNAIFKNYFPDIAGLTGKKCAEWKNTVYEQSENGEISVEHNGDAHILKFIENPISDSFGEIIGFIIIFHDITAEKNYQNQTLLHANTDFLTGLNNRRSLFAHLKKMRSNPQLSLITVDLDNFKKVNDNYGHKAGDNALILTSRIIREIFFEDFTARLGGDEFLVAVSRAVDTEQLELQLQKLLDTLLKHFKADERFSVLTASAGVSLELCGEGEMHDIEALMHKSDAALYTAKNGGKDCYCVYSEKS